MFADKSGVHDVHPVINGFRIKRVTKGQVVGIAFIKLIKDGDTLAADINTRNKALRSLPAKFGARAVFGEHITSLKL